MRRGAILLALLAALAGCGGGDGSGEGGGPKPAPAASTPFLGVSPGLPLLADPALLARETRVMAASGVSSLRAPLYWFALEPRRGRPDLRSADRLLASTARAGLDLLPVVLGTPAWAAARRGDGASPPREPADYARFLTALVGRYGPGGTFWRDHPGLPARPVRAWQVWNEPSHSYYWSTQPWAPSYVRLLRAAHAAVHRADPGARVVLGGFPDRSWESLALVERAGGHGAFDVAAVHPYTRNVGDVLKLVRFARRSLRAGEDGATPLWLTEVTWSSGSGRVRNPYGFETDERGQAARLSEALPLLARHRRELGIGRIYWETWSSTDRPGGLTWDWTGLREVRDEVVRPKPAFFAFRRVARQLRVR